MSQADEHFDTTTEPAYDAYRDRDSDESNGFAIAGFITSIFSVLTMGLLSPISGFLSLMGVFKEPRGFAIAGLIITCFSLAPLALFVMAMLGIMAVGPSLLEYAAIGVVTFQITEQAERDGALPDQAKGTALATKTFPTMSIRYTLIDANTFELRAPGPDKKFDTGDDSAMAVPFSPRAQLPAGFEDWDEDEDDADAEADAKPEAVPAPDAPQSPEAESPKADEAPKEVTNET